MENKVLKYSFSKAGYSIFAGVPFFFYEGDFGRLEVFLKEEMKWTPTIGEDFSPRIIIPFQEAYLNSEKLNPEYVHLEGGLVVVKLKEN